MTNWIPVGERLPEHGQAVLIWNGGVDIASFSLTEWRDDYTLADAVRNEQAFIAEHGFEARTDEEIAEKRRIVMPDEPHFSGGGGDCTIHWIQSQGFACHPDAGWYSSAPPITHWMPLPEAP